MEKGIIFDVQRFALHDGPGIRTAVFLKGCPLRCAWCCNPESFRKESQLGYHQDKCSLSVKCISRCRENVFSISRNKLSVKHSLCNLCGDCLDACPSSAIRIFGYETTVGDLMDEILKDKDYYDNSGGGLTLSGGEPLAQPDFCLGILREAKRQGIHTALETSGYTTREIILKTLPLVDFYLYDYKLTNPEAHLKYTGVGNKDILENLNLLMEHKASVLIRCPIIPTVNDKAEHFDGIANLANQYPGLKGIELLPYHDWGLDKYRQIGLEPAFGHTSAAKELKSGWINKLKERGVQNII